METHDSSADDDKRTNERTNSMLHRGKLTRRVFAWRWEFRGENTKNARRAGHAGEEEPSRYYTTCENEFTYLAYLPNVNAAPP